MTQVQHERQFKVGAVVTHSGECFAFTLGAEALIGAELCVIHDDMERATEVLHVAIGSLQETPLADGTCLIVHEAYKLRSHRLNWPAGGDITPAERQYRSMNVLPQRVRQLLRAADPTAESGLVFPGETGCPKAHFRAQAIDRFLSRVRRDH